MKLQWDTIQYRKPMQLKKATWKDCYFEGESQQYSCKLGYGEDLTSGMLAGKKTVALSRKEWQYQVKQQSQIDVFRAYMLGFSFLTIQ